MAKHNLKQMQGPESGGTRQTKPTPIVQRGSVKGQGKAQTFFTREQVANMSREEIRANYAAIKESEKRWK